MKDLEIILEKVPNFVSPKESLEQYVTPSNIASHILWLAFMKGDIKDRRVFDLGCGTGRLAFGAALLGAREVICVDVDCDALRTCVETQLKGVLAKYLSEAVIHYVACDIRRGEPALLSHNSGTCTVVMNPPFGVRSRGADMDFLKVALRLCDTVYSIHKVSSGLFKVLDSLCSSHGFRYEVVCRFEFPIRWFLPKHRRKVYYVDAVILRFTRF